MANQDDLKKGLQTRVGGQVADEVIRKIREDRALTPLEKQQISSQGVVKPLPQEQAQAIMAYLHIPVEQEPKK